MPDNEAGSLWELPDRQSPLGLAKSLGPGSPAPPSDSFLKRLGSLFHFFSKAETRVPQLEPNSAALSEPGGITCEADRSQQPSDTTIGQPSDTTIGQSSDTTIGQPSETTIGQPRGGDVGPQYQEMDKPPSEDSADMAEETAIVKPSEPAEQTPESL